MPNTREKLIELICSTEYGNGSLIGNNFQKGFIEKIAGHLIASGVTVPPCKVGDTIYEVDPEHGVVTHNVYDVCFVYKTTAIDDNGMTWDDFFTSDDIDAAYMTRREAEAELPEPPKGGQLDGTES